MPDQCKEPVTTAGGNAIESVLVGEELTLSYPGSTEPAVDCTRLDIPEGAVTAMVGPNGSGKSTLLKALARHLEPDEGTVLLNGEHIQSFDQSELARRMGVLSQENDAPGSLTVGELAYHGRYPHRSFFERASEDDHTAVNHALELAGVDHLRDTPMSQLSGGQKQLAWIAMVLAQETDVLLLDEPTTFLDMHHQLRVLETICQLNEREGVTVAVILHDIAQATRFADYLVALRDGQLYDWGPPADVVTEQLLADVFGVAATIERDPEILVRPSHALPADRT